MGNKGLNKGSQWDLGEKTGNKDLKKRHQWGFGSGNTHAHTHIKTKTCGDFEGRDTKIS